MVRFVYGTLASICAALAASQSSWGTSAYYELKKEKYDYVIIGSGPGGATVANMLSESGKYSVLLLEAGQNRDNDELIYDSANANIVADEYAIEYLYQAAQQANPYTSGDDEYINGRLLGGGSSINGEQYVRPTRELLATLGPYVQDDPDWSPDAVLHTLEEFERLVNLPGLPNRGYHGPLPVRAIGESDSARKFAHALSDYSGYPEVDYNNYETPLGSFGHWQLTQFLDTTRASASRVLLEPIYKERKNLVIKTRCTVQDIIFDKYNRAKGVYYTRAGIGQIAYATKYVILAAGHHSSLLLETSGIGNRAIIEPFLRGVGKPLLVDLPGVGENLGNDGIVFFAITRNANDSLSTGADLYSGGAFLPAYTHAYSGHGSRRETEWFMWDLDETHATIAVTLLNVTSRGYAHVLSADPLQLPNASTQAMYDVGDRRRWYDVVTKDVCGVVNALHAIDGSYDWDPEGNAYSDAFNPEWCGQNNFDEEEAAEQEQLAEMDMDGMGGGHMHRQLKGQQRHGQASQKKPDTGKAAGRQPRTAKLQQPRGRSLHGGSHDGGEDDDVGDPVINYFETTYMHNHHWFGTSMMAPREWGGVVDSDGNVYGVKGLKIADASIVPVKTWAYLAGATIAKKILRERKEEEEKKGGHILGREYVKGRRYARDLEGQEVSGGGL